MIKLFFFMIFLFTGPFSPRAAVSPVGDDQEFITKLDKVKNPFEDGIPKIIKPVVIIQKPVSHEVQIKQPFVMFKPIPVVQPVISLPALNLQGVIVSEDIHQAIIDDQVVPLHGTIKGVRVDSVTKQGVGLIYKGKKFFLKVD